MSRSKKEEEQETGRRSTTGSRIMDKSNKKVRVPIGVEKLLCRAAADPAFRQRLLHEREATLQQPDVELLDSEKTIVRSVPAATLSSMIDQIDLPRHGRKRFLRTVAACTLAAAAVLTTTNCAGGAMPDRPDAGETQSEQHEDGGIVDAPDVPTRGIQP